MRWLELLFKAHILLDETTNTAGTGTRGQLIERLVQTFCLKISLYQLHVPL